MEVLRTDRTLKCVNINTSDTFLKEIVCRHCKVSITFMHDLPLRCMTCKKYVIFPEHLFATVSNRLQYFEEGF